MRFASKAATHEPLNLSDVPDFFGPPVLARLVGCNEGAAYNMARRSDFPCRRVGRKLVINKDAFIAWWNQRAQ
jgi:hypothetical protein